MEITLWIIAAVLAIFFAYDRQLVATTNTMGYEFGAGIEWGGVHEMILPAWSNYFTMLAYGLTIADVILMGRKVDGPSAIGAIVVILLGSYVARLFAPKPNGPYFRSLIIKSMCSRYAKYIREDDTIRSNFMKKLLTRANIDVSTLPGTDPKGE